MCEAFSIFLSILKLTDKKYFYAGHTLGRREKNISNSVKASYRPFVASMSVQQAAKFYQNPANQHNLLIHLNRGNSRKNKSRVFRLNNRDRGGGGAGRT